MIQIKISVFFFLFSLTLFQASAQEDKKCYIQNSTFSDGEVLSYIIAYNWFVVYTEVGLVDFHLKEDEFDGIDSYHLKAIGKTFNMWDNFFKVRDTYESWVRKDNLRPLYFQRNTREGDFRQHENYVFDGDSLVYRKNKVRDGDMHYDTIPIHQCTLDVMSSLLYTRNLDYDHYQIDQKIPITVLLDEKPYDLYFRYLGKEEKKVKGLGTFKCLKFTVLLVEGTMFHEGEDMFIWVTDDKNHIPLFIQSPILIGSVKAHITSIKGNRYPLTSKIDD